LFIRIIHNLFSKHRKKIMDFSFSPAFPMRPKKLLKANDEN
jgi:hypothetical protein